MKHVTTTSRSTSSDFKVKKNHCTNERDTCFKDQRWRLEEKKKEI